MAGPGQTELTRDGRQAVSSTRPRSLALLRAHSRAVNRGQRVPFVLAMQNRSKEPLNFSVSAIEVEQLIEGQGATPLEVMTVEKLEQEERSRQVMQAILIGVAAGANAAAAANAGHYRTNTTIYTPRGTIYGTTTGYSPALAAVASTNAAIQNQMMIDRAVEDGQRNMERLERDYIKDHTILPGEWYGGTLIMAPPMNAESATPKRYTIRVRVGGDEHVFNVMQEPNGS